MKNAAYWQARFKAIEAQANTIGGKSFSYVAAQYQQAEKELEQQIAAWYTRIANNNGVSMHQAQQLLSGKALQEFHWTVQEYIQYGEENALNGQWMQQLENASAKAHITKLEALKLQNQATIEKLFGKQYKSLYGTAGAIYKDGYYHSCYEVQKAFGIGWNIAGIDDNKLSAILATPWAADGTSFSQRLWNNRLKLNSELQSVLTQGIMTGKSPDKMIAEIQKKMGVSKGNAGRLIMTESAAISGMAQEAAFKDLGVEEYEIVETLDGDTCDTCGAMDGKHFPMSDFQVGVTAPPFHPWCRGCTCPWFDDDFTIDSERIARATDGTQYYIPGNTTYQQWKDTFVDGDPSGFDIAYNPKSGLASFKQHKEPEPEPPKKEYMTKKKLEGLIADADTQISGLKDQFLSQTNGLIPYNDFLKDYAGDYSAISYDAAEEAILKSYGDQIQSIEGQKADWQEALDKKVLAAEKKKLKKESLLLQDQLDNFQLKTYSGIWKDDVTTADWMAKHGSIASKKQYFESKLLYTTNQAEIDKWKDLIAQVEDFDTEGKSYYELQKQLNDIQFQINNLGKPPAQAASQFSPEAYGQRKDDAWTTRFTDKYAADSYYRPLLDQTWDTLADEEKFAVWQYTHNSHPINRPLSGYNGRWGRSNYRGIGTVKWDNENGNYDSVLTSATFKKKFANTTNPAYGAPMRDYQDVIAELTKGIDKSSMNKDVWLVRGSDINGLAGLLEGNVISFDDAERLLSNGDVNSLLNIVKGERFQSHSFMSTGIADGTGFGGQIAYKIYAPKGTKAIYAEPTSYFGSTISGEEIYKTGKSYSSVGGEAEIIIQRGTTFRITDIVKKVGSYEVRMEVVDQPDYYKTGYEHTHDNGLTSEK